MKKILMVMIAVAGAMLLSAEMPRSEWHAQVGDCALDPNALKSTISQLSSADKTAFLAEVNAAIDKMPGSAESKAAKFLAANRAAVAGAGSADRASVLAEVYATVPPEALTVINEEFAKNEFARPATMTDDEYTNIVAETMQKINQRTSSSESGAVRSTFAGLMFIGAAGSASDATAATVISSMPSEAQSDVTSWIADATGKNGAASYDSMLASSQSGDEPNPEVVLGIVPMQRVDSMLGDLQGSKNVWEVPQTGIPGTGVAGGGAGGGAGADATDPMNSSLGSVPRDRIQDPDSPYYRGKTRGSGSAGGTPAPIPGGSSGGGGYTPEPQPYRGQGL